MHNECSVQINPLQEVTNRPKKGRKRKLKFSDYENKKRKNSGQSYCSHKKPHNEKPARTIKGSCNCKRLQCQKNIPEDERNNIFDEYWKLGNITAQRQYVTNLVTSSEVIRKRTNKEISRRSSSLTYFLRCGEDKNFEKYQVCKKFFINTLGISERIVFTALQKLDQNTGIVEEDKRGQKKKENESNLALDEKIKEHILSFPRMPSHYCRESSSLLYLPSDLNISKMYELFKTSYNQPVSYTKYQKVFQTLNLAFHVPKKDRCNVCERFRNLPDDLREGEKKSFEEHRARAEKVRDIKNQLKAEKNEKSIVAVFDLQKALVTPKSDVSLFYYSRKLSTFNFTVKDLTNDKVHCFMWNETDAGRGTSEVGSCLLQLLNQWDQQSIENVYLFSDACGGQNRSWNIVALFHYFLTVTSKNIKKIDHIFFESGHSQNENDNVHSVIECASRKVEVFIPAQWVILVKLASKKKPFDVRELSQTDVYDLDELQKNTFGNKKTKISQVQRIKYEKNIFFSLSVLSEFEEMDVKFKRNLDAYSLIPLYASRRPISRAKKQDLLGLCKKLAIPHKYHEFYENLPTDVNAVDLLF